MPTEQYYHPFGLANYAVTYSGYQVLQNALQWQRPLPDLTRRGRGHLVRELKDQTTITATVRNLGDVAACGVAVRFTDNGTQIGSVQTIAVDRGRRLRHGVRRLEHSRGSRATDTIAVTADPADAIAESERGEQHAPRGS